MFIAVATSNVVDIIIANVVTVYISTAIIWVCYKQYRTISMSNIVVLVEAVTYTGGERSVLTVPSSQASYLVYFYNGIDRFSIPFR